MGILRMMNFTAICECLLHCQRADYNSQTDGHTNGHKTDEDMLQEAKRLTGYAATGA